jgi:hypothetical protein
VLKHRERVEQQRGAPAGERPDEPEPLGRVRQIDGDERRLCQRETSEVPVEPELGAHAPHGSTPHFTFDTGAFFGGHSGCSFR